jgi:hypothetical protein
MSLQWKKIPGFSDYEVSENGDIRSCDREKVYKSGRRMALSGKQKLLRKHPANGFLMTDLIDDRGKRKTVYPHKVVALVFIVNEKPRLNRVVLHLDGNPMNNHYSNLKWSTVSDSIRRGFETGVRDNSGLWEKRRAKYGPKGGNKAMGRPDPLTPDDKIQIHHLRKQENYTLSRLAEKFNCSVSHIHKTLRSGTDA